jgi:hypothetical protein
MVQESGQDRLPRDGLAAILVLMQQAGLLSLDGERRRGCALTPSRRCKDRQVKIHQANARHSLEPVVLKVLVNEVKLLEHRTIKDLLRCDFQSDCRRTCLATTAKLNDPEASPIARARI